MNKYIALMISTMSIMFFSHFSRANEETDLCHSGEYTCHQIGPNYVVAYPNTSNHNELVENKAYKGNYYISNEHDINKKDLIEIDLGNLTWSAYDNEGILAGQGHVSGGKEYCADIDDACTTVTGTFAIYRKGGETCKSTKFPVGRGGAPMPYCMFFHGGYALHGSNSVPDYNASHGCVRMSPQDAQWLNEDFVNVGLTRVTIHY